MRRPTLAVALSPALAACGLAFASANLQAQEMTAGPPPVTKAVAVLHPTAKGGAAAGKITFTKVADGVKVEGEVTGLTPGPHGFHIHEFGDVSSPDAMSAGGHFNPMKMDHADPKAAKRHVGDMGNIEADAKGIAKIDYVDPKMSFMGATSILGRGVIVHAKADDLKSQPAGAAGDRVAAGTVGAAKAN